MIQDKVLYVFDLERYLAQKPDNKTWQYDVINLVSALQGLVNRDQPQLYILYVRESLSGHQENVDQFWLNYLRGFGGFLADYKLENVKTLEELLNIFRPYYTAVVLWDPQLAPTGNVALTVAGVEGLLPIRHDTSEGSLYTQIIDSGIKLPVRVRLTDYFPAVGKIPDTDQDSSKTRKGDAYLWAKIMYLDNKACSPTHMAFMLDPFDWDVRAEGYQYPDLQNCMIVNHDFYIAKKAFFMDLDPWWDEVASDMRFDPFLQGIDYSILTGILNSAHKNTLEGDRILRVGGFVPWWVKYSSYGNPNAKTKEKLKSPAETAEEFVSTISAFNGVLDADSSPFGALANASVFQYVPLQKRYLQNSAGRRRPLEKKNYLLFVIGDFRSSAQLYQLIPTLWQDLYRGQLPLAWAINPNLSERVPHIFNYLYATRTDNDFFVAGSSGPGLCYPNRFRPPRKHSKLGDGLFFLEQMAKNLYRRFDLRTTIAADLDREKVGPVLFDQSLQEFYKSFSPHGVATLKPFREPLCDGIVPFIEEKANIREKMFSPDAVVQQIIKNSPRGQTAFYLYRFNLATPTSLFYLYQKLIQTRPDLNFEITDPTTFFYLLRQHRSGDANANTVIPDFIHNTVPLEMQPNGSYTAQVTLRNDGWDTWNDKNTLSERRYRLTYRWVYAGEEKSILGQQAAYVHGPVSPGEETTVEVLIQAPDRSGMFQLILTFEQENIRTSPLQEEIRVVIR